MLLSEIAAITEGKLEGPDREVFSFSTDTRELLPEQLFFAINGMQYNGHDFLPAACEKKAAGAIICQPLQLPISTIQVKDTRLALGQLAKHHRSSFNMPIIAVTGSCGKTTTKTLIGNILKEMGPTLTPQKSYNNDIGVPLTLLQLNKQHKYAVIEMGANHEQEIAYLSKLAQQTMALITNVAPVHLEGFGSIENIAKAKGEIFEALPSHGTAILNADDVFFDFWLKNVTSNRKLTFGIQNKADISANNILMDDEGQPSFELVYPDGKIHIHLPLLGQHNVMNALAATAAAFAVGASQSAIEKGLSQAVPVAKRLARYQGLQGTLVIDDSYNANPLSVTAALQILAHSKGVKVFVFGDMGELGQYQEKFHQEMGEKARHFGIDKLYAYGKLSRLTVSAFGNKGIFFEDQASLIQALKKDLHPDMVILVKGSRSMRMENIVEAIRET
jgi:UDP-N-acetylmuramoyl-tripeptide--D-alanyl-D-alanine ligase